MSNRKGTAAKLVAGPCAGTTVVTIPVPPVPASRPRVSRWGVYYAKTYKEWMKAAHETVPEAERPMHGPLHATVEIVGARPKTTDRLFPRGDADNYAKAALDVLTKKGYWRDDDDVTELVALKRYALPGEAPHTRIVITLV